MTKQLFEAIMVQLEPCLATQLFDEFENDLKIYETLRIIKEKGITCGEIFLIRSVDDYDKYVIGMNNDFITPYPLIDDRKRAFKTLDEFKLLKEFVDNY